MSEIKKLVIELDVMKDILYGLHGSEKYNIDLQQMGEDIERMVRQLNKFQQGNDWWE